MSGDPNQYSATQQGGQPPQQHQTEDRNMHYGGQGGGYHQGGYQQGGYQQGGYQQGGYSAAPYEYTNPFAALVPSTFPPGTDPNIVNCFQMADQDRSGFIDDWELQRALSSCNQSFSLRTVHLLMFLFTNTNNRKIGECLPPSSVLFPINTCAHVKRTSMLHAELCHRGSMFALGAVNGSFYLSFERQGPLMTRGRPWYENH